MKKALAMLGMALTVVFSVPAVHAEQAGTDVANPNTVIIRDAQTADPNTVIIRDVANKIDYNTVIIRDVAISPDYTVIIRNEAPNFTPDWTVIIRSLNTLFPDANFTADQVDPNTVIIRDAQSAPTSNTVAPKYTVIIR